MPPTPPTGPDGPVLERVKDLVRRTLAPWDVNVYLFGSQASGRAGATSDIDVAIETAVPLPPGVLATLRETLEESTIPGHASSALPIPAGTVARGEGWRGDPLNTGRVSGQLMTALPFPVTAELLSRGQGRFNIYCTPCHGRLGNGKGIVVQRGRS